MHEEFKVRQPCVYGVSEMLMSSEQKLIWSQFVFGVFDDFLPML